MKSIILGVYVFFLTMTASLCLAGWTGPRTTVSGSWGNGPGQFGLEIGDTTDTYPTSFGVDKNGYIVLADLVNSRVQVFKSDGHIYGIIHEPPGMQAIHWPRSLIVLSRGDSFLGNLSVFDYHGSVLNMINVARSERYGFSDGYVIKNLDNNIYYFYSAAGQLTKSSATWPADLGNVSDKVIFTGDHLVTVTFPDISYVLTLKGVCEKYLRDNMGDINPVAGKEVRKFSRGGKELGSLIVPKDDIQVNRPGGNGAEENITYLAQYGQPVVAPNGDVYTWKRTPDKYSILKWTWVDDPSIPAGPDAPTGLKVFPAATGISLTWTASPQDPGCVTGYEIARTATPGAAPSTIAAVKAGVFKYDDTSANAGKAYYYKVRAVSGKEHSPFTPAVSGKR